MKIQQVHHLRTSHICGSRMQCKKNLDYWKRANGIGMYQGNTAQVCKMKKHKLLEVDWHDDDLLCCSSKISRALLQ